MSSAPNSPVPTRKQRKFSVSRSSSSGINQKMIGCECTLHGWLLKDKKKKKKKWFALVGGDLYWFPKQECDVYNPKKAKSWLPLDGDTICAKTGPQCFIVRSEGKQLELLYSKNDTSGGTPEEVIDDWVKVIKGVIEQQKNRLGADAAKLRRAGTLIWKKTKYYFVLRERYISWFKNEKAKKPLGKMAMHGVELDRNTTDSVTLTRQGEEMTLVMSSPREADEWYAALESVVVTLQNREKEDAEALSKIAENVGVPLNIVADGKVYTSIATTFDSSTAAKERVVARMERFKDGIPRIIADMQFLKVEGVDLYIIPEHVPMKQLPVFVLCSRTLNVPTLELVSKQSLKDRGVDIRDLADTTHIKDLIQRSLAVEDKREILMGQTYSTLLASQTSSKTPDTEFLPARIHLLKHVSDVLPGIRSNPNLNAKLPQYIGTEPLRCPPASITINCTLPKKAGEQVWPFPSSTHPSQIRDYFHGKFLQILHATEREFPREQFHLKVVGLRSFLVDEIPIISFDYVRACLNRHTKIALSLINPEASNPPDLEMEDFLYNITRVRSVPPDVPIPTQHHLIKPPPPVMTVHQPGVDIPPPPLSPNSDIPPPPLTPRTKEAIAASIPPPPLPEPDIPPPPPVDIGPPPLPTSASVVMQPPHPGLPLRVPMSAPTLSPHVRTGPSPVPSPVPSPLPDPGSDEAAVPKIGMSTMANKFRVRVGKLDGVYSDLIDKVIDYSRDVVDVTFVVQGQILYGIVPLCPMVSTTSVQYRYALKSPDDIPKISVAFNQWIVMDINMYDLPMESVMRLEVHVTQNSGVAAGTKFCFGWTNYLLCGRDKWFRNDVHTLSFWPGDPPQYIGTTSENYINRNGFILETELEGSGGVGNAERDIYYDKFTPFETGEEVPPPPLPNRGVPPPELVKFMSDKDKMKGLTSEQRSAVFFRRNELAYYPMYLPYFLLSVDWCKWHQVVEARRMLYLWAEPEPRMGLELLDWRFADKCVREYAVMVLDKMGDCELAQFLVQLVGVVKFEPFHDSPLSRFLVKRALQNHTVVGHPLFWLLKSEIHSSADRLGMILEAYLRGCDAQSISFLTVENKMINDVASVAGIIKETGKEERLETLKYQLRKLNFPPRFQIPLFNDRESCGLILQSCKYMKSKKMPLWLVFKNADATGDDTYVMYKAGDDLRQDVLTLQILRLLDRTWLAEGLDLCMLPYGVMSTGFEEGMVEIVRHSETIGGINREAGGTMAVFKAEVLKNWLQAKNPSQDMFKAAVNRFARSTAGYCVATYVFGIADRHNDNIMIREDGRLFHIDFGHILGHFKKKMGVKRERAPMIFTPQMAHVLGGPGSEMYTLFQESCCKGFRILRHNVDEFLALLNLTLCCDLPEVQNMNDVLWVRDHLRLDLTDEQADKYFLDLVEESLHTVSTQLMDMIHIMAN